MSGVNVIEGGSMASLDVVGGVLDEGGVDAVSCEDEVVRSVPVALS